MRCRHGSVLALLIVAVTVTTFFWVPSPHRFRENEVDDLAYQFLRLHERLQVMEEESLKSSRNLGNLLHDLRVAVSLKRNISINLTDFSRWKEINNTAQHKNPPTILNVLLPHLKRHESSLYPNVLVGQQRSGVSLVFGIPTVKREKESYLMETLKSLLFELTKEEKDDSVIVVFIAEVDVMYVNGLAHAIKNAFPQDVEAGLLEVVSPSFGYYPDFTNLRETFGDSKERVKWRTKQNLDYSFLMLYAQNKGTFYVQLEDDIVARSGYYQSMKNFVLQQTSADWMVLEFSQLGFIGKLFRTSDLPLIVEFILMFHKDKPIDWLLEHILWVKVCNPEKDADKDFGKQVLYIGHPNPPATIKTTLKAYQKYTFERAYNGEDYFWAFSPEQGDSMTIVFNEPLIVESYFFRSGNIEHPSDKLLDTIVEVLPEKNAIISIGNGIKKTEDGYFRIGSFENGIAEGKVPAALMKISGFRLTIQSKSTYWVLLSEIFIKQGQ
ncbi:alpha-1,3-mannosyl-glycoprotein 4-beta-N-acetylglucosaminyltransferase B-like isoform X3 [Polypterus senegalus]|uniref:alpha-1,3-mannosyl-glycoprotein 4-beta-N-acetylglucosaminyltransferase B-like isoform X3 n=1 Tax=Polypterus senegalus TaxID=55291 RepID=UPI0019654214|nr:alpha-1,3-mannosyl-glycoprotein 4-beta-N-acetylglucosaminyltransferase B-like isoform X3 [Polypterus senegalus]